MSDDEESTELTNELQAIEAALLRLRPDTGQLDRDQLLFLAGQASARAANISVAHTTWWWPAATAGMTGIAAFLLAALLLRPDPPLVERVVYVANERTTATPWRSAVPRSPEVAAFDSAHADGIWSVRRPWPAIDLTLASESSHNSAVSGAGPDAVDAPRRILSTQSFDELLVDPQDAHHHHRRSAPRPPVPGANL